ncbi:MAG: hypothetical protein HGA87_03890 [Desulfobulbaceae bacterium]|nr:hypothetical protein [Desulfobulbaceae bacterium]
MKEFPKVYKSWLDALEKLLIVIGLLIALPKGCNFVVTKTEQSKAATQAIEARTKDSRLLAESYVNELKKLNDDIRVIDEKIEKEPWDTTEGAKKGYHLREEKVKDKQRLLESLGNQVIELRKNSW